MGDGIISMMNVIWVKDSKDKGKFQELLLRILFFNKDWSYRFAGLLNWWSYGETMVISTVPLFSHSTRRPGQTGGSKKGTVKVNEINQCVFITLTNTHSSNLSFVDHSENLSDQTPGCRGSFCVRRPMIPSMLVSVVGRIVKVFVVRWNLDGQSSKPKIKGRIWLPCWS